MNNPFANSTRKNNAVTPAPVNVSKKNPQRDLDFREVWSAYRVFYNKRNRFMKKYNLTELDQSEKDLIDDAKLKQESLEMGRKNGSVAEDVYLYRKFERGQQTMKRGLATLGSASTAAQQRIALGARGISNVGQSMRRGLQTRRVERPIRPGSVAAVSSGSTNPFNQF
jgi:hypothetical protein